MTVNERVKEIRKHECLTLEKFGERLGVGKVAISLIENGKNSVTSQMCKLICREFNVNEEWLRDGVGEMFVKRDKLQIISEFAADMIKEPESFKTRLFESLAKLDEKDWIAIGQIFDKLTGSKDS